MSGLLGTGAGQGEVGASPSADDVPSFDPKFSGVFAPICTPFARDESVDDGALRANLGRYASSGLLGYLALRFNGENRSLSENARLHVLGEIVRHRGPGQVVIAGAT